MEKVLSQNPKLATLIMPGISKNLQCNPRLKTLSFLGYRFTSISWQLLGDGIAKSRSLTFLSLTFCGLNYLSHLEGLMKGVNENESIETINLSDNDLNDQEGLFLVRYIKNQAEKRENALWRTGLRHSDCS